jgi:hypothetical protein
MIRHHHCGSQSSGIELEAGYCSGRTGTPTKSAMAAKWPDCLASRLRFDRLDPYHTGMGPSHRPGLGGLNCGLNRRITV